MVAMNKFIVEVASVLLSMETFVLMILPSVIVNSKSVAAFKLALLSFDLSIF